jgi:hypothetical protein
LRVVNETNPHGFIFCLPLAEKGDEKAQTPAIHLKIEQLTSGSKLHFFGYIGQCQTTPWNASGRYVLGLEIDRIDRLPTPDEAATVGLAKNKTRQMFVIHVTTTGEAPSGKVVK